MLLAFKAYTGRAPEYLCELLTPYTPQRPLRSSSDKFMLEIPRTNLVTGGDQAFSCAAPHMWNELPLDIRSSTSVDIFKRRLKAHLFRLEYKC